MDEQELLQALRDARLDSEDDNGALTAGELASKMDMHVSRARKLLRQLMDENKVEVMYVYRDSLRTPLTGTRQKVPGYRLLST
jgi:ribosomal protein S25